MNTIIKKYECKNLSGQTLFSLELVDYYHLKLYLWISIPRSVIDNKDVNRMIWCIEERKVPENLRLKMMDDLFKYILKIPGIDKYYMSKS